MSKDVLEGGDESSRSAGNSIGLGGKTPSYRLHVVGVHFPGEGKGSHPVGDDLNSSDR